MQTSESVKFLKAWKPDGPWLLTAIVPDEGGAVTASFTPADEQKMIAWIDARQGKANLYFTVNDVMRTMNGAVKPKKVDMKAMVCLHVDVDPRPREDITDERARALKSLQTFNPPPTWIIDSGGGYQGYWKLKEPIEFNGDEGKATELEAYNQQLAILLYADKCHNIDRIMRLPGTINVPDKRKRDKGRKEALASVVEYHPEYAYELKDFTAAPLIQSSGKAGLTATAPIKISGNLPRLGSVDDLDKLVDPSRGALSPRCKAVIVQGDDPTDPTKFPSRSEALWYVVCEMVRAGLTDETIASVILDPDFGISASVLEKKRSTEYAADQIRRARESAINPWLLKLNSEHAVIEDIGGKCRVISEVMDTALGRTRISRQSFDDFRNRYMHIMVDVGVSKDGKPPPQMPLGKWWLMRPERRQFKTMLFAPGREIEGAYNLWRGFACEAIPGDCSLFLEHVKNNICSGNEEWFEYTINWCARMIQKPDTPGEVSIVLRGRMGTGKGVFVKTLGSLLGRHFLQVSDPKHLVGNFNSHLRDCVLLFGDEAFYAGDKKNESILKTLVTEETLIVEGKGVDAEAAANYTHLILASNGQWVVPAGSDERRFFVMDVNDKHMQDTNYFKKVRAQMDAGGREALLHMLLTRDISAYNVREFPRTQALMEQKELSQTPEEQWWHDRLIDGRMTSTLPGWPEQVTKEALQNDYLAFTEKLKVYRKMSPTVLGRALARFLPEGYPKSFQKWVVNHVEDANGNLMPTQDRVYYYKMPPLKECRDHWDKHYGGKREWIEPIDTPF